MEEIAIIEICGRWAEATVMLRYHLPKKNPSIGCRNSPGRLDKQFVLDNAEFIAANYYESIEELASRLMNGTIMDADEIGEAIQDGLLLFGRVN